jgi:hypothetical protein
MEASPRVVDSEHKMCMDFTRFAVSRWGPWEHDWEEARNGNSHGCDTGLLGGAGRTRRTASTATTLETGCGVCAPTTHAQFTFVRTNGKCRHLRRKRHSRKYPVGYDFPGFRRETCTLRKRMAPASVAPRIPRTRQESINLRNLMRDPKTVYAVRTQ